MHESLRTSRCERGRNGHHPLDILLALSSPLLSAREIPRASFLLTRAGSIIASRLLISSPLYARAVSLFLFSSLLLSKNSLSNRFDLINFFGNRIILLSFLVYFSLFVSPFGSIILRIFREVTVNIEPIFVFASVASETNMCTNM